MKKTVKKVLSALGFEIRKLSKETTTNPFRGYDYAEEGEKAVQLTKAYSMMPQINLLTLFEQAAYCEKKNIGGAYVECGVWKGGAVGIMAKANMLYGKEKRPLHLFDVFDDIPAPNAEVDGKKAIEDMRVYGGVTNENEMKGQLESVKGFYDSHGGHGTINICRELLESKIGYDKNFIHFHKGWFQDTVPHDAPDIGPIAILRLDGDWYESIKICLEHLYDQVVPSGLVVIDDYGYYEGCTKAVDEFLEKRNIKTFLSYSNIGCRYFVKPTP